MLTEIYCRNSYDPYYNPFVLETSNELEALLTRIRMILYTKKGEVLGEPGLGMNLESMLFEKNVSAAEIKKEFQRQLAIYVQPRNYEVTLEVNFVPGTVRDICYLDIFVNGNKYLGIFI